MAKKKTGKTKHKVTKHKRKKKPKTLWGKLKHMFEKKGQGLPMTTIVIIIIVLIVLAVVVVFFFSQFTQGQSTATAQQNVSISATTTAKCNAWLAGLLSGLDPEECKQCPPDILCKAEAKGLDVSQCSAPNKADCLSKYGIEIPD